MTELPSVLESVCTFGAMAETSWGLVRLGGVAAGSMGCMGNEHAEGRKQLLLGVRCGSCAEGLVLWPGGLSAGHRLCMGGSRCKLRLARA